VALNELAVSQTHAQYRGYVSLAHVKLPIYNTRRQQTIHVK